MASALYPKAKEAFLSATISLSTDEIKCILVDTDDYIYSSAHQYLSSIDSGARIGTPQTLENKSVTNGIFSADDVTFTSVTGDPTEAVVLYKQGTTDSNSSLIAYIEGSVTPNGGDITVKWSTGASKIFAL